MDTPKNKGGRPREYPDKADMTMSSLYLPTVTLERITDIVEDLNAQKKEGEAKMSKNEFIVYAIINADTDTVVGLISSFKELRALLNDTMMADKEKAAQLEKLNAKLSSPANIYRAIQTDPTITNLVQEFEEEYVNFVAGRPGAPGSASREEFSERVYTELESRAIAEGKTINKYEKARAMILHELFGIEKRLGLKKKEVDIPAGCYRGSERTRHIVKATEWAK